MSKELDKYASRVSSDNSLPDPAKESVIVYLFRSCSDGRNETQKSKANGFVFLSSASPLPLFLSLRFFSTTSCLPFSPAEALNVGQQPA